MENVQFLVGAGQTDQTTLLIVKIAAMFILGLSSLGLGMLPLAIGSYRLKRRQKSVLSNTSIKSNNASSTAIDSSSQQQQGLLTSLLLCFGGGVLLFTTFLHLAPEVRQSIERHQSAGQLFTLGTLSMAELLFCMGFFLVYFVEETVHATLTNNSKPESSQEYLYRTVSIRRYCNEKQAAPTTAAVASRAPSSIPTITMNRKMLLASQTMEKSQYNSRVKKKQSAMRNISEATNVYEKSNINKGISSTLYVQPLQPIELSPPPSSSSVDISHENDRFVPAKPNHHTMEVKLSKSHHHHHHQHHEGTSARGLLTVVALSFHAVFEGLAVGLEPAVTSVIYLAIAIATHKLVIAFCVGLELYVSGASKKTVFGYLSVLSIVTPLGIIIGLALSYVKNNDNNDNLGPLPTILQGMAAGTLLYVVFFEVLARERANDKSGLLQLAAILTGFMLMLGLQLATSHVHSHHHGHDDDDNYDQLNKGAVDLKNHHSTVNGNHEDIIADTIEQFSSTVAKVVTNAYTVSTTTTESTIFNRAQ